MTIRTFCILFGIGIFFLLGTNAMSQPTAFRALGSAEGMRTLTSWHCTFDGFGHLWVTTSDGLMRYNGNEINYYYAETHPELRVNHTGYLFCDSKNNIWICTGKGLVRADQNRILKHIEIVPEDPERAVNYCIEDSKGNIMAISGGKGYLQKIPDSIWIPQPWLDTIIQGARIRDIRRFDGDSYLIIIPSRGVHLVDIFQQKQICFFPIDKVHHAAPLDDQNILIAQSGSFALHKASLIDPTKIIRVEIPNFFNQGDLTTEIEHLTMASNGRLYIATDGAGLIEYDPVHNEYAQFTHEAANPYSIAENTLRYIISDSLGNIAFTSLSGVNYTNVLPKPITYLNYFKTDKGEIYDDRVISIAEDSLHQLWVLMESAALILSADRQHSKTLTFPSGLIPDSAILTPSFAALDGEGRMWIAFSQKGIGIFNTDGTLTRMLTTSTNPGYGNTIERIRLLRRSTDGYMYAGAENGLFRIHQTDFTIDTFPDEPEMKPLRNARIVDILFMKDHLWVSTSPSGAAWQYTYSTKTMRKYTTAEGLISNRVYALCNDDHGSVFVGSYGGLNIIHPDGSMDQLSKGDGLPSTRIDAIVKAKDGSIWMTNTYNLIKYDPENKRTIRMGGQQGFQMVNYQIMVSAVLSTGELAFGTHKGMVLVDLANETTSKKPIEVFVFYKNAAGHEFLCDSNYSVRLGSQEHLLRFSFGVNNLMVADQIMYRYKLNTNGKGIWSEPSHLPRVDFNLNPGEYTLEVQAADGHEWFSANGPVHISIAYPWWRRWWVLLLVFALLSFGLWFYFRGRIEKYKRELLVAGQITDLESKALRAQMNPHFVFNSLNAIQECIVTGKVEEAYTYLSKFSRLLRIVLEQSDMAEVTLQEEMEVLGLYISLEKLRFKDDMNYIFEIDADMDTEEIRIPPMLIQPHMENAIWHGLRNKEGDKILKLSMKERNDGYLEVIVEDNGIGRTKAEEMRQTRLGDNKHKSKGKLLSGNRMELLKNKFPLTSFQITDLTDTQGKASGTRILLKIPILEKKEN